jgi:hypothetical protein
MKNLLFLDFDGVLDSAFSSEELLFNKLGLLVDILQEKPAQSLFLRAGDFILI